MRYYRPAAALLAGVLIPAAAAAQQHEMEAPHDRMTEFGGQAPLGIPRARDGSGTSWLPDASPMYAHHFRAGEWGIMIHYNAFAQYIDQGSERGDAEFGSINWFMARARRRLLGGELDVRAMMSLEPLTVGECGYPDLVATGEFCDGLGALHDRQHPHDLFMQLAASYRREITDDVAFQVYGAPAGAPALGPTAYPHRISALPNPFAPIGHHWLDATHISFGVVTAGVYGRQWKLEGSVFNGREPDEERFGLDLAPLDSYSGRIWYLPSDRWAIQASAGHLREAEVHESGGPRIDVDRYTASVTYHHPLGEAGIWASTLAAGRNSEGGEDPTIAVLLESVLDMEGENVFFGRVEVAEKSGGDLVIEPLEEDVFTVGKLQLGYVRQVGLLGGLVPGIGASVSTSIVPEDLQPFYGTSTPIGFAIFIWLRPAPMSSSAMSLPAAPSPPRQ